MLRAATIHRSKQAIATVVQDSIVQKLGEYRRAGEACCRPVGVLVLGIVVGLLASSCGAAARRQRESASLIACRQLLQQGAEASQRQDWTAAETLAAQAVESGPGDSQARLQYAEALWARGAKNEALLQMTEATRLSPDDPKLLVRFGELRLATGAHREAHELAERTLRLDPSSPRGWALRGRVHKQRGNLHDAVSDFHRSLSYEPQSQSTLWELAELYRKLGEPDKALVKLQALGDTYDASEEPAEIIYLEGLAQRALGRHEDAANSFAVAVRRGGANPEILYRQAEAALLAGRTEEARIAARQAVALAPSHAAAQDLLANLGRANQPPRR